MGTEASLPVAVGHAQSLWVWIDEAVSKFPRASRGLVGRELVERSIRLLDRLVAATYQRGSAKQSALSAAAHEVNVLRLLLRGSAERGYLSLRQAEHAQRVLAQLGPMIGAWLRATKSGPP